MQTFFIFRQINTSKNSFFRSSFRFQRLEAVATILKLLLYADRQQQG
ncbi:MAG: hypothetical protein IJT35_04110 [Paludibacteraceae bacterium]|nr:hypothetical protein [Paludibacteraceae bacterium]